MSFIRAKRRSVGEGVEKVVVWSQGSLGFMIAIRWYRDVTEQMKNLHSFNGGFLFQFWRASCTLFPTPFQSFFSSLSNLHIFIIPVFLIFRYFIILSLLYIRLTNSSCYTNPSPWYTMIYGNNSNTSLQLQTRYKTLSLKSSFI